jgi:hypothetical protein
MQVGGFPLIPSRIPYRYFYGTLCEAGHNFAVTRNTILGNLQNSNSPHLRTEKHRAGIYMSLIYLTMN